MKICGISGSLRKASFNTALLEAIKAQAAPEHDLQNVSLADIPLYNGDDEEATGIPASVTEFGAAIAGADALLIATPEYNGGIPGVLKNAMDWASRLKPAVFDGKPTAIIGASPGKLGTVRAQLQLRNQLASLNAKTVAQPMVYVGSAGAMFGDGKPGLDEGTAAIIEKQLQALIALTGTPLA